MMQSRLQLGLLCTVSFLAVSAAASAQSYSFHPTPLQPRIEAGAKVGTDRSMGTMEGWAPILQDDDSVLYTDIRWMADDNSDQEGNLGIGYRAMVNDKVAGGDAIVGGHAWIDRRRTDRGSNFHQVTAGVEYMKEDWDVKANAYVPFNKEKTYTTANVGQTSPYLVGTGIFVDTNGQVIEEAQPGLDLELGYRIPAFEQNIDAIRVYVPFNKEKTYTTANVGQTSPYLVGTGIFVDTNGQVIEEAQPGLDLELGYRIPAFEQNIDAIRVYGGGYGFKGDRTDNTVGGRIRASVDINPLLNVGARFQYDEPRGSQGFLEATLRFPFTAKKRFQQDKLRARLDESPERDIDIVTGAAVDNGLRKQVINTNSHQVQRVLHVDNTAAGGGNGSVENPFNTLAAAQAALTDNDTLYIRQGDGTTTGQNQGIVIDKRNVQMIGSATDFVYDTNRFTVRRPGPNGTDGSLIIAAGAAPVITNNNVPIDIG